MTEIRKIITLREVVYSELGRKAARPVVRAVGIGVIRNPFAGRWAEDLRQLFEAGAALGERLMPQLVKLLDGPAVSYRKGALVGVAVALTPVTPGLVAAAQKEGSFVWYGSEDLQLVTAVATAFEAKYPSIKAQAERSGAERNFQRISQEYASNIHAVDIVTSSNP